jgi:hypothetical protein
MIRVEASNAGSWRCSECLEQQACGVVVVTVDETTIALCQECAPNVASAIHNKEWQLRHSSASRDEVTAEEVASFATYPLGVLFDELVECTVRWHVGPLDADERRIATALLERLAVLGIARKFHRVGCEIWPKYRLCKCPWEVLS